LIVIVVTEMKESLLVDMTHRSDETLDTDSLQKKEDLEEKISLYR